MFFLEHFRKGVLIFKGDYCFLNDVIARVIYFNLKKKKLIYFYLILFERLLFFVSFSAFQVYSNYNRCNVTSMKAPPIDVTCSQSWHYVPVGGERDTKTETAL